MYYKYKTIKEATKSQDWECTTRFNAGSESYRIYESKSTGERVVQDGKNEKADLEILKNNK